MWITSGPDLVSQWQENNKHWGAGRRFHRNRPHVKKVTVKGFSQKKAGGLLKEGESDVIEQQQKVFYHPFYKPPSKNIPTMMKMSDLNSTITRLWMVRAPSLFYYDFFILLWSLELKRQSGRQPARCFSFVFHCRYVARLPPQSLALPSPLSPPSQVILIKSVSLAWQAKIIGEGFWMPFTLNSGRFFPFSCFSFTLTASAITPPLPPLISCHAVTYLPFSSFFLSVHRTSKREIWINVCVSEGTASCELQILANTAIYLKLQIRQSNLSK